MESSFSPSSHLTFKTVEENKPRLLQFLQKMAQPSYILDLSAVEEFDSAGLAFLIEAKKLSLNHKMQCYYEGLSDNIAAFVRFFGVEELLDVK